MTTVALLLALGIARTSVHRAIENAYYDWWYVLAGVRYTPAHTAVMLIDDATFLALKGYPFAFWAPFVVVGEGNAGWGGR